jgi:hypothetical protein
VVAIDITLVGLLGVNLGFAWLLRRKAERRGTEWRIQHLTDYTPD